MLDWALQGGNSYLTGYSTHHCAYFLGGFICTSLCYDDFSRTISMRLFSFLSWINSARSSIDNESPTLLTYTLQPRHKVTYLQYLMRQLPVRLSNIVQLQIPLLLT